MIITRRGPIKLKDKTLLHDVVKLKKAFYNSSYAAYDDCLEGKIVLVPVEKVIAELRTDTIQCANQE